jgi:hypothetical protein
MGINHHARVMVYVEEFFKKRKEKTIADPDRSIHHVQTPKLVESIYPR